MRFPISTCLATNPGVNKASMSAIKRAWRLTIQESEIQRFHRIPLESYSMYVSLEENGHRYQNRDYNRHNSSYDNQNRCEGEYDQRLAAVPSKASEIRDLSSKRSHGKVDATTKDHYALIKSHHVFHTPRLSLFLQRTDLIPSHQSLLPYCPTATSIHRLFNRPILKRNESCTLTIPYLSESTSRRGDVGGECRGSSECVSY